MVAMKKYVLYFDQQYTNFIRCVSIWLYVLASTQNKSELKFVSFLSYIHGNNIPMYDCTHVLQIV